jgi:hypothetical protein
MCSINHEKKAIFIHIPKTAGSYLAEVLQKNYGFTNYYLQRPDHKQFCFQNYIDNSVKYHENKIHGTIVYYKTSKHLNRIMDMNDEKWNTYHKFCFVRNPFDRTVSGWNYCNNRSKYNIVFDKFINFDFDANSFDYWHTFMPQYRHIVNEKGQTFIDFIGYFENIEEDLKIVLEKLNLKIIHKPFIKNKSKHDNYLKYYEGNNKEKDSDNNDSNKYNQELIEKVIKICNEDFNNFNYNKEIEKSSNTTVL